VPDTQEIPSDPLVPFCREFLSCNLPNWPVPEDSLASAFVSQFPVSSCLLSFNIEMICAQLKIPVLFRQLPRDLAGYNGAYEEKKEIVLPEIELFPGIGTHTLFHEIREIIERVFSDLGYPSATGKELEGRAEVFAATVRMEAAAQECKFLFEDTANISPNWLRWGSIFILSILAVTLVASCALLPHFESRLSRRN
jgi:hypothetical protein